MIEESNPIDPTLILKFVQDLDGREDLMKQEVDDTPSWMIDHDNIDPDRVEEVGDIILDSYQYCFSDMPEDERVEFEELKSCLDSSYYIEE